MRKPTVQQHPDLGEERQDEDIDPDALAILPVSDEMSVMGQHQVTFLSLGAGRARANFGGFTGASTRHLSHG